MSSAVQILPASAQNPGSQATDHFDEEACRHDFSLTPCSRETFSIIHGDDDPHHGCQGNLEMAPSPYGIDPDTIPIAFKVFMHVSLDSDSGEIKVLPPKKQAG
jgi:uncharacterized protein YcgI (DUF1989 family)